MSGCKIPLGVALSLSVLISGCDLTGLLVKAQTDGQQEFTKAEGTEFADPELVGPVLADGIVMSKGFMYYVDDYEPLLLSAAFSRIAYGTQWLGYESHKAELEGRFDDVEHINQRAGLLYASALRLMKRVMRLRDDGFDAALSGGLPKFRKWVDDTFTRKDDAEALLLAGATYFVAMLESEEGLAAAVDLPYGRYMVERAVALDPEGNDALGLTILGTYWCTLPELIGGKPKLGMEYLEEAVKITERGSHSVLVTMAERCAVAMQDRKLYHSLLMEVIEAGDVPKYRLVNKLARRKAELLLKQSDEFFYDM